LERSHIHVDLNTWSDERIALYMQRLEEQMPKNRKGAKKPQPMSREESAGYQDGAAVRIPGKDF